MKKNQNGFSAVEVIIAIIVIGLIGVAGLAVYSRQNNENKRNDTVDTGKENVSKFVEVKDTVDYSKYDGWDTYTSTLGKLSFKHPKLAILSWSQIRESDSAKVQATKIGDVSVLIEGEPAVQRGESGPARIITIYKASLTQVEQRFSLGLNEPSYRKKEYVRIKGVNAILYTDTQDRKAPQKTYLLERKENKDTVVVELAAGNGQYLDSAYQGMFDTLNLGL